MASISKSNLYSNYKSDDSIMKKGCPNLNIGHSSRSIYDSCAYEDRLSESVSPLGYRLNANQIHNCDQCLSTLGPRSSFKGQGVSTSTGHPVATSQSLVDVESVLSNRNLKKSKCRRDEVNSVDVTKFKLQHMRVCNDYLNPLSSRLSYPAANYREVSVNRFIDLPQNAQKVIYWDNAVNTTLEAKDNFMDSLPNPRKDNSLPQEIKGKNPECKIACSATCPK